MERTEGKVKFFNEKKGYGFVTADSKDYFVHFSEIQSEGFKTLKEGDAVSFDIAESEKGLKAVKVQKM